MTEHEVTVPVIVVCADIMTASNIAASSALEPVVVRSAEAAVGVITGLGDDVVVLIDLQEFVDLARDLRDDHNFAGVIIGFAPHVRTDLLDAARPFVTSLKSRGAVVQRLDDVVRSAIARRDGV